MVTVRSVALCLMLALGSVAAAQPLADRVAPPEQSAIALFEGAGMRAVRPHVLTAAERARVQAALAALPPLHRSVLAQRLRHLSFVDGIPGAGTGLTAPVEGTGQFDITLRASLIDESLARFLTTKEQRVFAPDHTGLSVVVEASGADALTYVLLHEATHVVDGSLKITENLASPFVADIWTARRELAPALSGSMAATTIFRGGERIPVNRAAALYSALAQTPFVSLYATTTAQEDLAELVAWHALLQRWHATLAVVIVDAQGKPLMRFAPLAYPAVKARMARVEAMLARLGGGR